LKTAASQLGDVRDAVGSYPILVQPFPENPLRRLRKPSQNTNAVNSLASRHRDNLRSRWQVLLVCSRFPWSGHDLPSALESRQNHLGAPGRVEGPLCFSSVLRQQRLRFVKGSFQHRLCASRRSRRPLSSESEINLSQAKQNSAEAIATSRMAAARSIGVRAVLPEITT